MCGWRECRRVHSAAKPFPPGSVLHSNDARRKQLLVCMRSNPNSVSEQSRELTDPSQKCWREQDNHKEKQSTTTKRAHFYFCPCQLHDPRQPLSPPGGPHLRCEPSRLVTLKVLSKQKKLCVCTRTCVCTCVQNFKQ